MKGIILAGGKGTRLYPATLPVTKQLLQVYDKPMIYYPLSMLMLSGIKDILIVSDSESIELYYKLFQYGKHLGINISYVTQDEPNGLPEAFILGEEFIGDDSVCLILGDNIFFGHNMPEKLRHAKESVQGGHIFGYQVSDPERYGVLEIDIPTNRVISVEEKPENPKTNFAIPGIYFFDKSVVGVAKSLKPSARGETEITDVIRHYMKNGTLTATLIGRGIAWLDSGTHESLLEAGNFVRTIQERQGMMIACIEEIAYKMGFITKYDLKSLAENYKNNSYGKYLLRIVNEVWL